MNYFILGILVIVNFLSSTLHILGGALIGFALADFVRPDPVFPFYVDCLLVFLGSAMLGYRVRQWEIQKKRRREIESRVEESATLRDKYSAAIAAILENGAVIISRGKREGVDKLDVYRMGDEKCPLALFEVVAVKEKMAFTRLTWLSKDCPIIERGTQLWLVSTPAKIKPVEAKL